MARAWQAESTFIWMAARCRTKVDLDYMNQPFDAKQPLRIGGGLGRKTASAARSPRYACIAAR